MELEFVQIFFLRNFMTLHTSLFRKNHKEVVLTFFRLIRMQMYLSLSSN
jgi:hypothetical protein